jgi:hypothetical protein
MTNHLQHKLDNISRQHQDLLAYPFVIAAIVLAKENSESLSYFIVSYVSICS